MVGFHVVCDRRGDTAIRLTLRTGHAVASVARYQVLRYFGWFKEPILYSRIESYRVRRVSVCYYLVDDTLAIEEQPEDNSGIDQVRGCGVYGWSLPTWLPWPLACTVLASARRACRPRLERRQRCRLTVAPPLAAPLCLAHRARS